MHEPIKCPECGEPMAEVEIGMTDLTRRYWQAEFDPDSGGYALGEELGGSFDSEEYQGFGHRTIIRECGDCGADLDIPLMGGLDFLYHPYDPSDFGEERTVIAVFKVNARSQDAAQKLIATLLAGGTEGESVTSHTVINLEN